MSLLHIGARREARVELSCFRDEFYPCLTARSDVSFKLGECGSVPGRPGSSRWPSCRWRANTAAAMGSTPLWPMDVIDIAAD